MVNNDEWITVIIISKKQTRTTNNYDTIIVVSMRYAEENLKFKLL